MKVNLAVSGYTDTASRQTVFDTKVKPNISADTGMVIYQLIDNINSDERLATFEHDAEQLIANTKAIEKSNDFVDRRLVR